MPAATNSCVVGCHISLGPLWKIRPSKVLGDTLFPKASNFLFLLARWFGKGDLVKRIDALLVKSKMSGFAEGSFAAGNEGDGAGRIAF